MTETPELKLPPGIPESIPLERVRELVSALGLPLDDLCAFRLSSYAIEAEFYATDPANGMRYVFRDDNEIATHKVIIKVVD